MPIPRKHLERASGFSSEAWSVEVLWGPNLALDTRAKRIAALKSSGAPASLVDQLQPTSCIGLSLDALGVGFGAPRDAALESAWKKIYAYTRANDLDGCALLDALQRLGWRIV